MIIVHLRTEQDIINFVFADNIKYQFKIYSKKILKQMDKKYIIDNGHEIVKCFL